MTLGRAAQGIPFVGGIPGAMLMALGAGIHEQIGLGRRRAVMDRQLGMASRMGVGMAGSSQHAQAIMQGVFAPGLTLQQRLAKFAGGMQSHAGGGQGGFLSGASALGYMPEEAAALTESFARSRGFALRGGSSGMDVLRRVASTGVSPGALGSFEALGGVGQRGLSSSTTREMLTVAFAQGLRGAGIDRSLAQVAANTSALAAAGGRTDVSRDVDFMGRATGMLGTHGSAQWVENMAGGLTSAYTSARQELTNPFQEIPKALALAEALKQGGGLPGALRHLDKQGASGVTSHMYRLLHSSGLPQDVLEMITGGWMPADLADNVLSGTRGGVLPSANLPALPGPSSGRKGMQIFAEAESRLLAQVDWDDIKKLVELSTNVREMLLGLAKSDIAEKVVETLDWLVRKVSP